MSFDRIIPAVSCRKCDVGCSTITITDERLESVNFSESHYDGGCVPAVSAAALRDQTAADEPSYTKFNGKCIGIRTGSSFEKLTFKFFPNSQYVYFDNDSDLIQALSANKIDGFLDDEPVAKHIHSKQPAVDHLKKS